MEQLLFSDITFRVKEKKPTKEFYMNNRPYIGVTGITSRHQALTLARLLPEVCSHDLMLGVLASNKTLAGEPDLFPNQTPSRLEIEKIFPKRKGILNLLHYYTSDSIGLFHQMAYAYELAGKDCDGLQLNIAWPDSRVLQRFRKVYPKARLVLQIGRDALQEFDRDIDACADETQKYEGIATDILFDLSGGEGKAIDPELAWKFTEKALGNYGMGVAGGLEGNNLSTLKKLFRTFADCSIDAQGRLRDANDHLDLRKAKTYVQQALALLAT